MERDAYDDAVEYLTANPADIKSAWLVPPPWTSAEIAQAHCLFGHVTPDRQCMFDGRECGCITQIRGIEMSACRGDLTIAIREDSRLPDFSNDIKVEHLPIFAEWQRRLDRELNRTPPKRIGATT